LAALRRNVQHARRGLRALGWELDDNPVPILCLRARDGLDLARLKECLFDRDICVAHVTRYSSTPPGGCLRVAIFSTHAPAQIDCLCQAIATAL
jgi:glycine C-acetyltransferase/8-amino-7-oxononanoate synthase